MNEDRIQVYSTPCNAREPLHIKRSDIEQVVLEVLKREVSPVALRHPPRTPAELQEHIGIGGLIGQPDPLPEAVRELMEELSTRSTVGSTGDCKCGFCIAYAKVKVLLES